MSLSTWWEARRWRGRRRRSSAHQPSGPSRPAVPRRPDSRSQSAGPARRHHRRRRQPSRSRSSSIISRAPSPPRFRSSPPRFRRRFWNPSQRQRAAAKRQREAATAASPEPRGRQWAPPKARPAQRCPTPPPHQVAHSTAPPGLPIPAPRGHPGHEGQLASSPAGNFPASQSPADDKVCLYAFGDRGPEPNWRKKRES